MQSTTPTSSNDLDICVMRLARDAYVKGGELLASFQAYHGQYLAQQSGAVTAQQPTRRSAGQQKQAGARNRSSRSAGQTRAPSAGQARTRSANQPRTRSPRVRTAAGTPGPQVAKVLAKIVSSPEINIEGLRRSLRTMGPNIVGTALGRLFKAGHISGTPKVGPFTATAAGIEANNKQPTSINARRRTTGKTTHVTEPAGQMQQTG